jgi:hypothetical protein
VKLALRRPKDTRSAVAVWVSCLPFVDNERAVLIHRPKAVQSFKIHRLPHLGVDYWCGGQAAGNSATVTVGQLRAARAALKETPK